MIVREARIEDVPKIVHIGNQFREEIERNYPLVDPEAVFDTVRRFSTSDTSLALVSEHGREITGFLTGYVGQYTFSLMKCGKLDLLYVRKPSRGGKSALLLIQKFISWSKERGARSLTTDLYSGIAPETTARFFEKNGFYQTGETYMRSLT